jgi:hypothetical protein
MSTDFETTKLIYEADLFDGRLAKHGVREHFPAPDVERGGDRCLTDGKGGFLWVWCGSNVGLNNRLFFTRYAGGGANGPVGNIIHAIETEFNTHLFVYDDGRYDDGVPDELRDELEPTRDR